MDNVTHAIFLAFAMFSLVIGLSFGLYLLTDLNSVATKIIRANDATTNYKAVSLTENYVGNSENEKKSFRSKRNVGLDTVISTLYNYGKESYSVEIYNGNKLYQIFDLTVENVLSNSNASDEAEAYISQYGEMIMGVNNSKKYAPWLASTDNFDLIQDRVNLFVSSQKGYINGSLVDYDTGNGLEKLPKNNIQEQFIQYTYDGETISDSDGEDVETVTGSIKAHTKIVIRYIFS